MAITTTCSGCGKTLAVADEFAGRQARCPSCGQIYTVPSASAPGDAPSSAPFSGAAPAAHAGGPLDLGAPTAVSGSAGAGDAAAVHYWMKTTNGHEYGPVDRATLDRWFSEGRVGTGYEIRMGEFGSWQPAHVFQPGGTGKDLSGSTNPFAPYPTTNAAVSVGRQYPKPDQSGLVLAMGILSWIVCPICGVIAWVMGSQALRDMQQGTADPANRGLVQVGYYLGMVNVILAICCLGFYVLLIAMFAIGGNL